MNRLPILLTLIALVFVMLLSLSCKKDNKTDAAIGKWERHKSTGGIMGTVNYPAGNGNIYQFYQNGTVEVYKNSVLDGTGTYSATETGTSGKYKLTMLVNQAYRSEFVTIEADKLTFLPSETCCDIPTVEYLKIP